MGYQINISDYFHTRREPRRVSDEPNTYERSTDEQKCVNCDVWKPRTGQDMRLPLRSPVQKQPLPVQAHHQTVQTERGREQAWRQLARV